MIVCLDVITDPRYKRMACKGCDDTVLITTDLPYKMIDHTAWEYISEDRDLISYQHRGNCWDAYAAADAVEALAAHWGFKFTSTQYNI